MAYKNDSYLVIANKFGSASGDAKAMLFETYDKLRDLTEVSYTEWQVCWRRHHLQMFLALLR